MSPPKTTPKPGWMSTFASAYGIFAGKADKTAILRFSAERARSVIDEWLASATSRLVPGRWLERALLPYRDRRELVMDIFAGMARRRCPCARQWWPS